MNEEEKVPNVKILCWKCRDWVSEEEYNQDLQCCKECAKLKDLDNYK